MPRDWHEWYADYDDPASSLSRRLEVVRAHVARLVAGLPHDARVASACAGDGRDLLPFLGPGHRALLVELDPALADRARAVAADRGLAGVEVVTGDAGHTAAYERVAPVSLLLLCGVLGNVSDDDAATTVAALPGLVRAGAHVVWTRGCGHGHDPSAGPGDPADAVRALFEGAGFVEEAFVRPTDAGFRVGVHRFAGEPRPWASGRLFTFV